MKFATVAPTNEDKTGVSPANNASFPSPSFVVYPAADFVAIAGVNYGDAFANANGLCLDDEYQLQRGAAPVELEICIKSETNFSLSAANSSRGLETRIQMDCKVILMTEAAQTVEALVLVEVDEDAGTLENIYVLPFVPIDEDKKYRLIDIQQTTNVDDLLDHTAFTLFRQLQKRGGQLAAPRFNGPTSAARSKLRATSPATIPDYILTSMRNIQSTSDFKN